MSEAGEELVRRYTDNAISIDELEGILSNYNVSEYSRDDIPGLVQDYRSDAPNLLDRAGGRWITALSVIGALLIFAGIGLAVSHFIEDISDIVVLGGTLAVNVAFAAGGYAIWDRLPEYRRIGHAWIIVAVLMVGVSLSVLEGVIDPAGSSHWLALVWAATAVSTAYALKSRPAQIVGLFVLGFWVMTYVTAFADVDGNVLPGVMLLYGAGLAGLGTLHNGTDFSKLRNTYLFFGVWAALYTSFVLLAFDYSLFGMEFVTTSLHGGLGALSGLVVGVAVFHEKRPVERLFQGSVYGTALLSAGILSVGTSYFGGLYPIVYVFANVLLLATIVLSVLSSYREDSRPMVSLTLFLFIAFVLHVLNQTIFELLPTSLSVLVGGAILLGMAYYLQRNGNRIKNIATAEGWAA